MRVTTKIAILGAGISGLLAAKACVDNGFEDIAIIDKDINQAKVGEGLHYLHDNCGLLLDPQYLLNMVVGLKPGKDPSEQYARKIFNRGIPPTNSMQKLPCFTRIYDMRQAHQLLWERYKNVLFETDVLADDLPSICRNFEVVISTIPTPIILPQGQYPCEIVYGKYGLPQNILGLESSEHITVYNVNEDEDWYRCSRVFGMEFTEVLKGGDFKLTKVLDGTYRNPYKNLILAGRYGQWKRGVLAHQVYYQVSGTLKTTLTH